jgi:hypothetical protein
MPLVKPPDADPTMEPFRDGLGELRLNGELVGHVATSVAESGLRASRGGDSGGSGSSSCGLTARVNVPARITRRGHT